MTADFASAHLALLFDALLAALLLTTIVYAAILNRKLAALRNAKQEMERVVDRFAAETEKAESGLAGLRQAAGDTGQGLQSAIERGTAVADDLVFLLERVGALANRLEGQVPALRGKTSGGAVAGAGPQPAVAPPRRASGKTAPEHAALVDALRGMR